MTADLMELVRKCGVKIRAYQQAYGLAYVGGQETQSLLREIDAADKLATLAPLEAGGLSEAEQRLLAVLEPHTRPLAPGFNRCDLSITGDEAATMVAALRRLTTTPAPSAVAGGRKKNAPILPIPVCGDCGAEGHERHADACQLTPTPEPKAGALAGVDAASIGPLAAAAVLAQDESAVAWVNPAVRYVAPASEFTLAQVVAFLDGSDALDGVWFGDRHPTETGEYWWRKHLRAALQAGQAAGEGK